jgi:hypothetical protein
VRGRGRCWVVEVDGTRLREEVEVLVDNEVERLVERIIRHEEQQPVLGYVFKYLSVQSQLSQVWKMLIVGDLPTHMMNDSRSGWLAYLCRGECHVPKHPFGDQIV